MNPKRQPLAGPLHDEGQLVADFVLGDRHGDVVRPGHGLAVDGDDDIAPVQHRDRGHPGREVADGESRRDRHRIAGRPERDHSGGRLRAGHLLQALVVQLRRREAAGVDHTVFHEVDVGIEPGLEVAPKVHVIRFAHEQKPNVAAPVGIALRTVDLHPARQRQRLSRRDRRVRHADRESGQGRNDQEHGKAGAEPRRPRVATPTTDSTVSTRIGFDSARGRRPLVVQSFSSTRRAPT